MLLDIVAKSLYSEKEVSDNSINIEIQIPNEIIIIRYLLEN